MSGTIDFSLKISNYKCFGEKPQGFERIAPLNLIIGRNNAGKSALLDMIEQAANPKDLNARAHRGTGVPTLTMSKPLEEHELAAAFPDTTTGGVIGGNWGQYGRKWLGKRLTWTLPSGSDGGKFCSIDPPFPHQHVKENETLARVARNPLKGRRVIRLSAERDVVPESEGPTAAAIAPSGAGATALIQAYMHHSNKKSELVERVMLDDLNRILEPDTIDRLRVLNTGGKWEIFFEEKGKGRVALSESGSGLKTLMLVLAFLTLLPDFRNMNLGECVFLFEELENNLHPSLQRRLVLHLIHIARTTGAMFFLTTHSSATVDLLSREPAAQIIHVTHDRQSAAVITIEAYSEHAGVLDDLDVRASDLLQSNCVVWVEGPSDRVYFNRWIDLWTNGTLREGAHYQCVFYGGSVIAHLSGVYPDDKSAAGVRILNVNRRAIVVTDSDRRAPHDHLKPHTQRLVDEVKKANGLTWVSAGKEVENYIPHQALLGLYPDQNLSELGQFDYIGDHIQEVDKKGNDFGRYKVLFCERVCPLITREGIEKTLDLAERLDEVVTYIRKCNGMSGP